MTYTRITILAYFLPETLKWSEVRRNISMYISLFINLLNSLYEKFKNKVSLRQM